ncbi:peptidase S8 [Microbacterium mangrovi]|uniref:Peptidase S8 n=2 Tax=Microbacterium mangrovi TaxID=1348253 RepID=A0A0B2A4Q8_9MICO|nr:peptidase S8 [Microbacterium mangrovi]
MRRGMLLAISGILAVLVLTGAAPPPDDPADPVRKAEYWLDSTAVRDAWRVTQGQGQTIAVIDTGVGRAAQLDPAVRGGTDESGVGSSNGRTPVGAVDADHGSWVASLIAAQGESDGSGMIGVAPKAKVLSVSLGFGSSSSVPFAEQVAKGIRWAVDQGASVINLSFTTNSPEWDPSWDDAFLYAYQHDVVIVVAAGNRGSGTARVGAPATIPGVLTVAGVTRTGSASREASTQGITIGVAAPSEELLGISADGQTVSWEGTSGAAPIVAGIIALVRAAHPHLDANDVIERVIQTARRAPPQKQVPDATYGYGIVDAAAAVSASGIRHVDTNPMGSLVDWIRLHRRAEAVPVPEPSRAPATVAPLPPATDVGDSESVLLPTAETLRYGTIPLAGLTVPAILVVFGIIVAVRRIRSARHSRTPNN